MIFPTRLGSNIALRFIELSDDKGNSAKEDQKMSNLSTQSRIIVVKPEVLFVPGGTGEMSSSKKVLFIGGLFIKDPGASTPMG